MNLEQIRTRNWQKARLIGFNLNISVLSESELIIYKEILDRKDILLAFWDQEYERLLGHKLKPYKCSCCGKKSNKEYLIEGDNYCFKHYKEFK